MVPDKEISLLFHSDIQIGCSFQKAGNIVQLLSCSVMFDSLQPHDCSIPGFPISRSLLKLMSIESVTPPKHLILCHPLLLLPSFFPSIRVFSNSKAGNIEQHE